MDIAHNHWGPAEVNSAANLLQQVTCCHDLGCNSKKHNGLQLRLGGRLSNCCCHLSCHPWTRETLTHSHRFQWKNTPNSESKPRVFDGWVDDCRTAESIYPVTLELVKTWSSWSNLSAARFSERVFKHLPKSDFSALQSDFSTLIFGQKMVFFLYSQWTGWVTFTVL